MVTIQQGLSSTCQGIWHSPKALGLLIPSHTKTALHACMAYAQVLTSSGLLGNLSYRNQRWRWGAGSVKQHRG